MKELSVFDIIGPCMIGPSSSHTAGALKIALLAGKMVKGHIKKATFELYGSFARTYEGHGTDRALVAGILGFNTEDERIRDSFQHAKDRKIDFEFIINDKVKMPHPNTVDIRLEDNIGKIITIRGESIGGGAASISQINGIDVSFSGEYSTIVIEHKDEKGVLAYITKCFSDFDINIAFSKLFREEKGKKAYTIIETDELIQEDIVAEIESYGSILNATLIEI